MEQIRPQLVTIDDRAVDHLLHFCASRGLQRLLLVADRNTYAVLGEAVAEALLGIGSDLKQIVFSDEEVVADGEHIFRLLLTADRTPRTYVVVGSGTLTDITRFASHRTQCSFISLPTAPSVDGYASIGAPLIIGGVKETVICHAPIAIIGDVHVLGAAPRPMIAAGLGDMLGKYTSIADWRLGALLWNEPYDEQIARRTLAAVQLCVDHVDGIAAQEAAGIRALTEGLIESGYCMLDFGTSRPASGAEHHCSHFWEMKLLAEGRPAILHGAKVGAATVRMAELYDRVRSLTRAEVADRLEASTLPAPEAEIAHMRRIYGETADGVIASQRAFLALNERDYDTLKQKILAHWDAIQAIAADVPSSEQIAGWLRAVDGPASPTDLPLSPEEVRLAEENCHYLRDRFTVRKLAWVLGGPLSSN